MSAQTAIDPTLIARRAIELRKELDQKEEQLAGVVDQLRQFPPQTIPVEGFGKVQIKKGAEAFFKTNVVFDESKWKELPKSLRQQLIDAGVVRIETRHIPAKKPSVAIQPNK